RFRPSAIANPPVAPGVTHERRLRGGLSRLLPRCLLQAGGNPDESFAGGEEDTPGEGKTADKHRSGNQFHRPQKAVVRATSAIRANRLKAGRAQEAIFMFRDALAAIAAAAFGTAADGFPLVMIPAALLDECRCHIGSEDSPTARTVRKPPTNPRMPLMMASISLRTVEKPIIAYASRLVATAARPAAVGCIPISIPMKRGRR